MKHSSIKYIHLVEIYSLSIANTAIWLVTVLTIYQVASAGMKVKKKFELSFNSFTRRIVAGVSSALFVWINSIIFYRKKYCCSFFSSSEISIKTITILAFNFNRQSIEILSSYSNCSLRSFVKSFSHEKINFNLNVRANV